MNDKGFGGDVTHAPIAGCCGRDIDVRLQDEHYGSLERKLWSKRQPKQARRNR